jgi:hypothetical protein
LSQIRDAALRLVIFSLARVRVYVLRRNALRASDRSGFRRSWTSCLCLGARPLTGPLPQPSPQKDWPKSAGWRMTEAQAHEEVGRGKKE